MEKSCSECPEPTLAQSLCTLCNKWLCYQCTDVHQHQRAPAPSQYTDLHQHQRPSGTQCADLHQRGSSSMPPTGQVLQVMVIPKCFSEAKRLQKASSDEAFRMRGETSSRTTSTSPTATEKHLGTSCCYIQSTSLGSYPCSLLMCHSHRQEPLELFCESCDLLCCSSCHLSSHKNHRVGQIGKALQDQQWLFESLMVQVEERRSAVENNAKQIEDRLHGVKIAHRKAENQIKMAKMIMMNELNKRANLLIEQLEKISEDFQQRLEDQLQGAIEICGQLDHVQKFITWATTHHCRGPVLFSRALISLQMQQLLELSLHSDSWNPVKIKFNWDASYWAKQISSLGQLTVEGGNCSYPQGLACSNIMGPQPITCLAVPSVFHRGLDAGCGYQACCEPQMCCLHGIPSQPDLPSLDKSQREATLYNSSCVQPPIISAPLHQNQQLQKFWDTESSPQCPPPASLVPIVGSIQLNYSRSMSQPQAADSQPHSQSKSYPSYHHHQREVQAQLNRRRSGECQGKLPTSTSQQERSHAAVDRDVIVNQSWEERCRVEETHGQTAAAESRELLSKELQRDRREQNPVQQQQQLHIPPAADQRKEHQRTRRALTVRGHRNGRRSTSLEVSVTAHDCVSNVQSSRLSPSSVCRRRKRRSQSIPAELAPSSSSTYTERPTGYTHSLEAEAANKYVSVDPRQRRASDGLLCVVKEASSDFAPFITLRSPLLSYKTEPDQGFTYVNEDIDYEAREKCKVSRNGHNSNRDVQKDSGKPRVPVVCLERLKILVSQLPPHGRRQSDPLPASTAEKSEALPVQRTWHDAMPERIDGGAETRSTTHSFTAPPYVEPQTCNKPTRHSTNSECDCQGRHSCHKASTQPSTDPECVPQSYSGLDLDSDSDPRSVSEEAGVSQVDPDPQLDSDASPVSDPNAESSSEAELAFLAGEKSMAVGEMELHSETDIAGDSEPSFDYEADPESDAGPGSEDGQDVDANAESGEAETESDIRPECDASFQPDTDSEVVSDQHPDSHGSVESELDVESEPDEPQSLRSDLEEESHIGPGQRQLLIANPVPQRGMEEVQPEQDNAQMDSEDFCAVCLIGGDLLCCDHCPKVFHLSCHIPPLLSFPSGDWVCSLCRDIVQPEVEYDCENERTSGDHTSAHGLSACDQRKCERLTLLILSNILSAPFHEPVSPLARHYYQIIKRPMDLSVIKAKLNMKNTQSYSSPDEFVADVYLMFRNCAKFNYPDSEVAQAGHSLEAFFTSKLKEVFSDRVFPAAEVDSDSDEYDEAYRTADGGFPWPQRREHCHRKRKRRHSLKSRRHHF